jgi:hypothetical protein
MGEMQNAYKILIGNPDEMRPFRKPRSRWEDNIIFDLKEVGCEGVNWVQLAQNMFQWWTFAKPSYSLKAGNLLTS